MNEGRADDGPDRDAAALLSRDLGFAGLVPVTWSAAGGILFGGFSVAVMTLLERMSAASLFLTAGGLFILGAAFGFVHGGVLGFLGRKEGSGRFEAAVSIARAVLYSIPGLAVAWAITGWIALTTVALFIGKPLAIFGIAVGWILGLAVLVVAAVVGSRAFGRALRRWPDRVPGTTLVGLGLVALVVTFLFERPEVWWTDIRLPTAGPVILAGGVTVWLVGPLVTLALWLGRRLPGPAPSVVEAGPGRALAGAVLGVATGCVLGFLAHLALASHGVLPLASWTGASWEVTGVALSQAFVDEILLRLFAVTGVVWLLRRWRGAVSGVEVGAAVTAGALLHVVLYVPGIVALGLPSPGAAVGYAAGAIFVPSLVYGVLYWRRSLTAAVLAHATTVTVAALLLS